MSNEFERGNFLLDEALGSDAEPRQQESVEADLERKFAALQLQRREHALQFIERQKSRLEAEKDNYNRASAYTQIAGAEAKLGLDPSANFENAKLEAAKIKEKWQRVATFREIATTEGSADRFDAAITTAEKIEYPKDRALAYETIARTQAHAGRFDDAKKTIASIKHARIKQDALVAVLVIESALTRSLESFESEEAEINKIPDGIKKNIALDKLAGDKASAGFFEQAKTTAYKISDADAREAAFFHIYDVVDERKRRGL